MSTLDTIKNDFKGFASTTTGHVVIGLATSAVVGIVGALLKDPAVVSYLGGGAFAATVVRFVTDVLDGQVTN